LEPNVTPSDLLIDAANMADNTNDGWSTQLHARRQIDSLLPIYSSFRTEQNVLSQTPGPPQKSSALMAAGAIELGELHGPFLSQRVPSASHSQVAQAVSQFGVMFVENVGQFDLDARFVVYGADEALYLTNDAIWLTVLERLPEDALQDRMVKLPDRFDELRRNQLRKGAKVRFSFVGASPSPRIEPFDHLA
jgi:hypothetical protein